VKEAAMDTLERTSFEHLFKQADYRPEELADLLEVDVNLIRHAIFIGELPAKVIDHHILEIPRSEVIHWLTDRDRLN
jgi:hypothetical protein